eukprot:CAMPEP_0197466280 /NCGR_PEP_ID=MMETSP1175-20131217/64968_1 /TAXON_ID=1003142 /ORGANISM="Triceratium dubium, Strain CCMP147" /LENGTH=431 /DNA_ID=CAMNT_0043002313 /DNA_START=119 /DNA_END=1415 /DNA_ORIENTATION=-
MIINPHAVQALGEIEADTALEPIPFPAPVIHSGCSKEEFLVLDSDTGLERREKPYLVRSSSSDDNDEPQRAYRKIRSLNPPIVRNGRRWGEVVVCLVLERKRDDVDGIVFVEPPPDRCSLVAIKELNKSAVDEYLSRGGTENPYREISAMQAIGDGVHVAIKELNKRVVQEYLSDGGLEDPYKEIAAMQAIGDGVHVINCLEALQEMTTLWIVMPYCDGGDLWSVIHENPDLQEAGPGLPEAHAKRCFREILECVEYLQRHGVCHGDISAENVLIHNGRCILIDLGCCFRVPAVQYPDGQRRRTMLRPFPQRFGKGEYMAPEIFFLRFNFDGYAIDIWSAGVTLFHMLTGDLIEHTPVWAIVHRSLNNFIRQNVRLQQATTHINGVACDLINQMLREPTTRPTLRDVAFSAWVASLAVRHMPMDRYLQDAE